MKINKTLYPPRVCLTAAVLCFLTGFLLLMSSFRLNQEALASRIAPDILRFHILANSDQEQDQQVKLEIRSLVLDYVQNHLSPDADKEEAVRCISEHQTAIEALAGQYLAGRGFRYGAALQLLNCYFPARSYGSLTFPCGLYDTVRIVLGEGKGHNWWCVLYPRFCFTDAVCSEVPAESMETLKEKINQDDFLALKEHRPDLIIRFRILPEFSVRIPAGPEQRSPGQNPPAAP